MDNPIKIFNALKVNRPQLGKDAGVGLYRLFRLVAMEDVLGKAAPAISYFAGKKLGIELNLNSVEELLNLCEELKIGIIKVTEKDENTLLVEVFECVTCDGMDPVGRALCSFEGGLIAGCLEGITGKKATAKEVTCIGGFGDESCGFNVTFLNKKIN